ncbi:MAG: phytanoyl-CoA dioxygenase family protein [Candidatus Obscuribacterales bacterium]|jgi:hypothetical protein
MYNTQGKTFFELATDRQFWLHLNPQLKITDKGSTASNSRFKLSPELGRLTNENLQHEGYFKIEKAVAPGDLAAMVQAVEKIRDEQWPVTFSFVYDEFWLKFQELSSVLSLILGPEYKMMPTLYTFCVAPGGQGAGFLPHRDRSRRKLLRPDGQTVAMNIWISLTDASPDTGCIYILPVQYDPNFPNNLTTYGVTNYQDIRALPTKAGDILGWNEGVYHWGGRSSKHGTYSRISIAASFQRGDSAALETPLLIPNRLPSLKQRLSIIAAQLLRYQAQAALSPTVRQLAVDLQALDERLVVNDDGGPYIYDESGEKIQKRR